MGALLERLSPRQREVVRLVVYGQATNKDVAERLALSMSTVQTHRAKINARLGVHSTQELMALVYREDGGAAELARTALGDKHVIAVAALAEVDPVDVRKVLIALRRVNSAFYESPSLGRPRVTRARDAIPAPPPSEVRPKALARRAASPGGRMEILVSDEVAGEIDAEANRLSRSRSWLLQEAWRRARERMRA